MEATTKELRLHSREILAAIDRGERVTITYRGKPRAILVPWVKDVEGVKPERNPVFGLWQDQKQEFTVDEQVRELRQPRSKR